VFSLFVIAAATAAMLIVAAPAFVAHTITASDEKRYAAESSVRTTILQASGGLVVLLGLALTARTVYLTRETHLTDRLTTAVDLLGHQRPEVRIGAIYALRRLAQNSPADLPPIVIILRGYLASRAIQSERPISPDVQAALDVYLELG
jgi:hypothetical protein